MNTDVDRDLQDEIERCLGAAPALADTDLVRRGRRWVDAPVSDG